MRKIIVSVLIVLAISAGAYLYFYQPLARHKTLEAVLPGDTLGFVRVCELKKQIERFKAGRMGRALGGIDLPRLLTAMEIEPQQRQQITHDVARFEAAIDSAWFDTLFGQDISLALLNLSADPQRPASFDADAFREALVMVARPRQPTRVLDSLNSMFAADLDLQTQPYRGWTINQAALDNGRTIYYALTDGVLIAGLSAVPVKRCLDQSLEETTSLLRKKTYQANCAGLFKSGTTDLLAFADAGRVMAMLREALDRQADAQPPLAMFRTQLDNMRGIDNVSLAQYDDGGPLVNTKMIVGIDKERLAPGLARTIAIAPARDTTLSRIPADALIYSWQNTFDLKLLWEQMKQNPGMTPETVAQIEQSFAMQTGMALDPLLDAFGTRAGLLLNNINMDAMFPIPELALFIEVRQPDVIDSVIRHQLDRFNMPLQQEAYQGTDLRYVILPAGGALSPAYTFSDGICILAINRSLLKGMLNSAETGRLGDHPNFKALGRGLTEPNNQVFYMRTEGLVAKTRELIGWGMSWWAMAKPDGAGQAKEIIELGVNPLLDGLSMIKAVGGRTSTDHDRINSEIRVLLDRI